MPKNFGPLTLKVKKGRLQGAKRHKCSVLERQDRSAGRHQHAHAHTPASGNFVGEKRNASKSLCAGFIIRVGVLWI